MYTEEVFAISMLKRQPVRLGERYTCIKVFKKRLERTRTDGVVGSESIMVYRKVVSLSHFTRNLANLMDQKSRCPFMIITYFTKPRCPVEQDAT